MNWHVGESISIEHVVSSEDIEKFSEISGDKNPIHLNDEYAKNTSFGRRIAHGMFTASFFSGIFGTKLPGPGCLYVSQTLKFKRPVFVGDRVVAEVVVKKLNSRKKTMIFKTVCRVEGLDVTSGEAEIYIPDF